MNKAYEFLCSKSSRTVQGPDPHNIVLILKAQSILFKRYREGMVLKDKFTLMYHKISILDLVFKVDVVDSFGRNMGQEWHSGERERELASHRCGPSSIPDPGVTCGLSLLLILVLAPRILALLPLLSFVAMSMPTTQFEY